MGQTNETAAQVVQDVEEKELQFEVVRTEGFSEEEGCEDFDLLKRNLRVLFIHGGGSRIGLDLSKQPFARYLRAHFTHTHVERVIDTSQFEALIAQQANAIYKFQPDVVVTHSQGGPTIRRIIELGVWSGPTLIAAPAFVPAFDDFTFPRSIPVLAIFGDNDEQVPLSVRDLMMEKNADADPESEMKFYTIGAWHSMSPLLTDKFHPSLCELVHEVWNMKAKNKNYGSHSERIPKSKQLFPNSPLRLSGIETKQS